MEATIITITGDADRIHAAWRDQLLPVAAPLAQRYGWRRSLVARDGDAVVVVNLWEDGERLDAAFADPEIDRVQREALAPLASAPPEVRRLRVVEDLEL
jgi:quinol monooxygenase YgiN